MLGNGGGGEVVMGELLMTLIKNLAILVVELVLCMPHTVNLDSNLTCLCCTSSSSFSPIFLISLSPSAVCWSPKLKNEQK